MKSLKNITPSPEQLTIIKRVRTGVELIRGAAGSGKTTTAILKLKLYLLWINSRRQRQESKAPARALILTFNRTLRGYINDLILENSVEGNIEITVDTFSHWAYIALNQPEVCNTEILESFISSKAHLIGLPTDFLKGEVEYAIGRFPPEGIHEYLTCRRDGRGSIPRVEKTTRQQIIDLIIAPYNKWKKNNKSLDWNDLAVSLSKKKIFDYDIIIADESQDFSANILRALMKQLSPEGAASFILDTAQRIYSRGFTWSEVGITIRPETSHRLTVNYRNPPGIAKLANSLLEKVSLDEDGTTPTLFDSEDDIKPFMLKGLYSNQVEWCIRFIRSVVDLTNDSVAFLHPKGGGWFVFLEQRLKSESINFIDISRRSEWPKGPINVALSTLHSAKGLDFDHVFIIGLSKGGFPDGTFEEGDDRLENTYRLLAMAIARARKSVTLGYKDGEQPSVISALNKDLYTEICV